MGLGSNDVVHGLLSRMTISNDVVHVLIKFGVAH
jgi:hypothetical protein